MSKPHDLVSLVKQTQFYYSVKILRADVARLAVLCARDADGGRVVALCLSRFIRDVRQSKHYGQRQLIFRHATLRHRHLSI